MESKRSVIASYAAELLGMCALSYGAFSLFHWLGFVVVGVSLILIGESLVPSQKTTRKKGSK